jgi:hypothetical protein
VNILHSGFADGRDAAAKHGFGHLGHAAGHLGDAGDFNAVCPAEPGYCTGIVFNFFKIDGDVGSVHVLFSRGLAGFFKRKIHSAQI